ncbi:MAG: DUF2147 domain-containing protein [Pseudomonadota bacterium]
MWLGLSIIVAAAGSASAENLDVEGLWLTDDGSAHVRIAPCGSDDQGPCGALAWIDPAVQEAETDVNNPDPALQARPLIGLPIIWGFQRKKDDWRKGRIYDPEDGKTYRSRITLKEDGTLQVKGCVGPVCRSLIWTRVSEPTLVGDDAGETGDVSDQ